MIFNGNGFTSRIFIIPHSIVMRIHLEIYWCCRCTSSLILKGKSHLFQNILKYCRLEVRKSLNILLKESGIDISKDEFWQQGFDLVAAKIQELKKMN